MSGKTSYICSLAKSWKRKKQGHINADHFRFGQVCMVFQSPYMYIRTVMESSTLSVNLMPELLKLLLFDIQDGNQYAGIENTTHWFISIHVS